MAIVVSKPAGLPRRRHARAQSTLAPRLTRTLLTKFFPFTLPFDLPFETAQIFLDRLGDFPRSVFSSSSATRFRRQNTPVLLLASTPQPGRSSRIPMAQKLAGKYWGLSEEQFPSPPRPQRTHKPASPAHGSGAGTDTSDFASSCS